MERHNPTSRAVFEEERAIEDFLAGGGTPPPKNASPADPHAGHKPSQ
jgi:hypothetical protein